MTFSYIKLIRSVATLFSAIALYYARNKEQV